MRITTEARGFTFIELLVATCIIGVLMAGAALKTEQLVEAARLSTVKYNLAVMSAAGDQDLPIGNMDEMKDPWGTPYKVENDKTHFRVSSAGPDRVFGTPDDIVGSVSQNEEE